MHIKILSALEKVYFCPQFEDCSTVVYLLGKLTTIENCLVARVKPFCSACSIQHELYEILKF